MWLWPFWCKSGHSQQSACTWGTHRHPHATARESPHPACILSVISVLSLPCLSTLECHLQQDSNSVLFMDVSSSWWEVLNKFLLSEWMNHSINNQSINQYPDRLDLIPFVILTQYFILFNPLSSYSTNHWILWWSCFIIIIFLRR